MVKKGVFKDARVPLATRLLRMMFGRSMSGAVGAAVAVPLLGPELESLPGLPGSLQGKWQAGVGSALVGFGIGYGAMSVAQWLRWKAIGALLTYNGWIFDQKSKKTTAWGLLLKVLVGPGPHRLHDFDGVMPHLPVPALEDTCKKYLESLEPLLSAEEFARTKSLVEQLLQNDGPILQEYIVKKAKKTQNWLSDWWMTNAYLARRDPVAINVNFFMISSVLPEVSMDPLARASNILIDCLEYYEMVKAGSLPPDMIMNMIPTCMDGARFMLATCRIPGEHSDTIENFPDSTHSVVISNGCYYRVDMYPIDPATGRPRRLTKREMKNQLMRIEEETKDVTDASPVAVLTSQNRTKWAKDRQLLKKNPVNAATLKDVETALYLLVLNRDQPQNVSEQAYWAIAGDGATRWFDKSLTLECQKGCAKGGANMEHSGADATHFAIMWEHCLQLEKYGPGGDLPRVSNDKPRDLTPPVRLEWQCNTEVTQAINEAHEAYQKTLGNLECLLYHTEFGRRWMKSKRVSPDGFLQMAIQLAYYRMHGSFTKTYEPASHRLFALGRTDNINPVSLASNKWVKMMDSPGVSREEKIEAMKAAIDFQSRVRLEATAGYGSDRHLLGLLCAARELGRDVPELFNDKAYSLPMKLSTSQVPTMLGHLGLQLVPESIVGGFGPAAPDGYGMLYCSVGDDMFNFNITNWKNCGNTDSKRLAQYMTQAMRDMKDMLDGKVTNKAEVNNPAPGKL